MFLFVNNFALHIDIHLFLSPKYKLLTHLFNLKFKDYGRNHGCCKYSCL